MNYTDKCKEIQKMLNESKKGRKQVVSTCAELAESFTLNVDEQEEREDLEEALNILGVGR